MIMTVRDPGTKTEKGSKETTETRREVSKL